MAPNALLLLLCWACPALAGVRYDQTQTGDYNVHLDLKNIEIIAYVDSGALGINDYEYDYNDYTLKPPSNSSTTPSGAVAQNASSTASVGNSTTAGNATTLAGGGAENATTTTPPPEPSSVKPSRRCGAGFYRDPAGRCRRLRRPVKLTGLLQKATNRISGK